MEKSARVGENLTEVQFFSFLRLIQNFCEGEQPENSPIHCISSN